MTDTTPTIGARARRFVIELPRETPDGFGGTLTNFLDGPQVWGAMELVSAGERLRADRREGAASYRVTLPYREGLSGAMRLRAGARRFAIRAAADPDGRRRKLVCLVEEIAA